MKFTIKFKIVALGAVLSILVSSAAIIFGSIEYRKRGRDNQLNDINLTLDHTSSYFSETSSSGYLYSIELTRNYILNQYRDNPEDPDPGLSYEDTRNFYKDRFKWVYAIEGIAMYLMTDEEVAFRNLYVDVMLILSGAKNTTKSSIVYLCFVDDNNTLFYMGDDNSYKNVKGEDPYLPGSRIYNFDGNFVQDGDKYIFDYNDKMSRGIAIYSGDDLLAYLFIEYNFNQVNSDANALLVTEIIALSITSVLMILAFALGAHFLLIRNVTKLTNSATEFTDDLSTGSSLEVKDPRIKSRDEIEALSSSFVALESGIINYIDVLQKETQEKEKINAELSIANTIQLSALPNRIYDDKHVKIRSFIKSAKEVGGDFYDYFYLDNNHLVIVISDVSGKGVPAALFMMKSKELIKSAIRSHRSLVDAVKEVNETLIASDKESLFVTSFIGLIDFENNTITYVNAGHEKPYLVSSNKVEKLDGYSNFVLGGEEFEYIQESHPFNKGDYIFLFTDGLNESINKDREEFSYERIEKVLDENKESTLDNVIKEMNNALEAFVGEEEQFDDVTMLVIRNNSNELHLSYDKKSYEIIDDIVNAFEDRFAYLPKDAKASCGIIIDEVINNLVSYEKREDLVIDINFIDKKDEIEISIKSNGEDYNPFVNHKEKYHTSFDPDMAEGGFGLSIIKDLASSYNYRYEDGHSILTLNVKHHTTWDK